MHLQWFEYRCQNADTTIVKNSGGQIEPPVSLPKWELDEDARVLVLIARGSDSRGQDITVLVDVAPTLIKGWVIYQMERVRLTEGGMLNDRTAVFHIEKLASSEQVRIDLLTHGPYREASVQYMLE